MLHLALVDPARQRKQFETPGYRMRAIGYHGTSVEGVERILAEGFKISRNDYDWLGDGAYFFQDAPARATEWALDRFGSSAAVIGAEIDLSACMDLLDPRWHSVIRESYDEFLERVRKERLPVPRQTMGAHRLDREVINRAISILVDRGVSVHAVRAAFVEGEPLFPDSALWSRAHVQIAVRESAAIMRCWRES